LHGGKESPLYLIGTFMDNFSILKDLIKNHKSFLLTTHVNPDADAIGSQLALYEILHRLGKNIKVVNYSATPYNLEFLDPGNIIEKFDETKHLDLFDMVDCIIALDLNQANRVVKMEKGIRNFSGTKVCIDHHQNPENFTNYFFGGTEYSATGEVVFDFIEQTGIVEIDYRLAELLYSAIMTDTGSFRFEKTSSKIHKVIAQLLETGINPTDIYDKIYDQFEFSRIKLLGEALSTINLDDTKQIAFMEITKEDMSQSGATEADIDGFVNYCLSIKNVKIGILFYELKDGVKISFRSKGTIPVNKLAAEFNGGGHTNASGARLFNTTINDIRNKIITKAKQYLELRG
jgi:bifunctional oligoribonuclease and PAP phosphatase NrnA